MSEKFPIEPLFDRVFVKKDSADKVDGFYMPESVKGRAQTGIVVSAGPGYFDIKSGSFIPMSLKVGDRVFVKEFDGYIIRYQDHEFFVFMENEILGKVVD
jgi:co-chaperonin GroES (HSP10)